MPKIVAFCVFINVDTYMHYIVTGSRRETV